MLPDKKKGIGLPAILGRGYPQTDFDPSDCDGIITSLIGFAKTKDLDLEDGMSFAQCEQDFNEEKSDDKEKEKFIWQMANAIDALLNKEEEEEEEDIGSD